MYSKIKSPAIIISKFILLTEYRYFFTIPEIKKAKYIFFKKG